MSEQYNTIKEYNVKHDDLYFNAITFNKSTNAILHKNISSLLKDIELQIKECLISDKICKIEVKKLI